MDRRKQKAFTMIELVMVIIVLGILASMAVPRLDRDLRQDAADNILSAIRYTQHLALLDDKTEPNNNIWQRNYWHIRFEEYMGSNPKRWFYSVSSSKDGNGNVDDNEVAIDPANGKLMNNKNSGTEAELNDSPTVFISQQYGISNVVFRGGCSSNKHIGFDHLGRPHVDLYNAANDYRSYMTADCTMTFSFVTSGIDPLVIRVQKETGFASIVGQPNS